MLYLLFTMGIPEKSYENNNFSGEKIAEMNLFSTEIGEKYVLE